MTNLITTDRGLFVGILSIVIGFILHCIGILSDLSPTEGVGSSIFIGGIVLDIVGALVLMFTILLHAKSK